MLTCSISWNRLIQINRKFIVLDDHVVDFDSEVGNVIFTVPSRVWDLNEHRVFSEPNQFGFERCWIGKNK